jgi:hypothetical protein
MKYFFRVNVELLLQKNHIFSKLFFFIRKNICHLPIKIVVVEVVKAMMLHPQEESKSK